MFICEDILTDKNHKHPDYVYNWSRWQLVRNCIKADVKQYVIPMEYCPSNRTNYAERVKWRNKKFLELGRYTNFTQQSKQWHVGNALSHSGKIVLPPQLEYLRTSATGDGRSLAELDRQCIGELSEVARIGLLVDLPSVDPSLSAEQITKQGIEPRIYPYFTESITNWETALINGKEKLIWLLLLEPVRKRVNITQWESTWEYLELSLDDKGLYMSRRYNKEMQPIPNSERFPLANKKRLDFIPFGIGGSEDNNWVCDNAPLWPIAHLNIGHYRNSCSYETNLDRHGQSTLGITSDLTVSEWNQLTKNRPVLMGSDEGYFLGKQGALTLTQCAASPELANAMKHKEEQMVMINANIMTPQAANAPVETTMMHSSGKISILDTLVTNTENLIGQAIEWCGLYKGVDTKDLVYQLNHDFLPEKADPNLIRELNAARMGSTFTLRAMIEYYKKVNLMPRDKDTDEIIEEINQESPVGGVNFGNEPGAANNE